MLLSIVTVTYNSAEVLPKFFEGLGELPGEIVEAIVVDSGSDDTASIAAEVELAGGMLVEVPENVGYGFGSNIGARLATGEWLAFVNPDVEVSVERLLALVELARTRGLTVVGPTIRSREQEAPPSARPLIEPLWRRPSWEFRAVDHVVLAPSMSGCCMVVAASAFDEVGGFDPRFFMFAEETDLHLRLQRTGAAAGVAQEIVAYTEGGGSSEGVTTTWANVQRSVSRVLYSFKNLSRVAATVDLGWRVGQLVFLGGRTRVDPLRQFAREILRSRDLRRRRSEEYLDRVSIRDFRRS